MRSASAIRYAHLSGGEKLGVEALWNFVCHPLVNQTLIRQIQPL
jgi:hypothetical protein